VRKTLDPPKEKETKGEKNYITPAGYHKLTSELDFLQTKKRPEVVSALSDAAAEGDRSENAEYIYRKRQLRQIDGRMRFLGKRLDIAVIVDPREQKRRDRVFFGATVTVEDEEGEKKTFSIVGSDEIDSAGGAISWQSPVGRGLLGKAIGDTVLVRWDKGQRELTIADAITTRLQQMQGPVHVDIPVSTGTGDRRPHTRQGGQVHDSVDVSCDPEGLVHIAGIREVAFHELESGVAKQPFHVLLLHLAWVERIEIVEAGHAVAAAAQAFGEVGSDETRSASD
jgi:transcription elongation factor GreB